MISTLRRISCRGGYHKLEVVAISNTEEDRGIQEPNLPVFIEMLLLPLVILMGQCRDTRRYILCACSACSTERVLVGKTSCRTNPEPWKRTSLTRKNISDLLDAKNNPLFWHVYYPGWHLHKNPITGREYLPEEYKTPPNGEDVVLKTK